MRAIPSRYFFAAILIIAIMFLLMPWTPWMPHRNLDSSAFQTFTYAFQAHLQYGPDLTWTYGPLGFVQVDEYSPATYPWMIAIRALIVGSARPFLFQTSAPASICIWRGPRRHDNRGGYLFARGRLWFGGHRRRIGPERA